MSDSNVERPTQRIDMPTTQIPMQQGYAPPSYQAPSYQQANYQPESGDGGKRRRRWPVVVAIITVVAIVGGVVGGIIYKNKHDEAYARCQTAGSEFSEARKALLDTTSDSPALQKLVRNALGVDKILDAAADAASAAEGTVAQQGCAANATIIQLNLVANTLNSATESLRKSTAQIVRGASADTDNTGDESESAASSDTEDVAQAKRNLQEAIDQGRALLDTLKQRYADSAVGRQLTAGFEAALDLAQEKFDESGIKDSRYYKAAQATLDEATNAVNAWIDRQAQKAD